MMSCLKTLPKSNIFLIVKNGQLCHSNGGKTLITQISNSKYFHKSTVNPFFKKPRLKFDFGTQLLEDIKIARKFDYSSLFARLKNEFLGSLTLHNDMLEFRDQRHIIDILYTFERESDFQNFVVSTDSSNDAGYSSASFQISPRGTAIFSGNLCTEVPKTGNTTRAGFANVASRRKYKSFGRFYRQDWSRYTHLVLKVRGDGRTYKIILSCPGQYDIERNESYNYPLYTRGGPYWQVTKIPFSHFYFTNVGRIVNCQGRVMPLTKIVQFGITIADNIDGPFKLEIDYVGLEFNELYKAVSPYESYYIGRKLV